MIERVRIAATLLFATVGALAVAGCVNDYLYGAVQAGTSTSGSTDDPMDPSSSSGTGTGAGSDSTGASASGTGSTTGGSDASSSSSGSVSGESDPTATMGDGDGSNGSSGGETSGELCQGPCDANAMCGADPDLCVELTEGDPVCLRACGRGCPDGFDCMMRTSVEGGSAEQCVPDGNICP